MSNISINNAGDGKYSVEIKGPKSTQHLVTIPAQYIAKLTGKELDESVFVEKAFEFLLERESNDMILSRFDIRLISEYFPEFEDEMKNQFA